MKGFFARCLHFRVQQTTDNLGVGAGRARPAGSAGWAGSGIQDWARPGPGQDGGPGVEKYHYF